MRRTPAEEADLRELDRRLSGIRFSPRASLGPELIGRARTQPLMVARRFGWLRSALGVSGLGLVLLLGSLELRSALQGPQTIDRCCRDLDGGGTPDDGLLVEASGQQIRQLTIYEDRDHSGGFTRADTLRFTRSGPPAVAGAMSGALKTTAFCCLDFDGGGLADDGIILIGRPPDRIDMAALYERRNGRQDRYPLR